jgi:hypothetical protein
LGISASVREVLSVGSKTGNGYFSSGRAYRDSRGTRCGSDFVSSTRHDRLDACLVHVFVFKRHYPSTSINAAIAACSLRTATMIEGIVYSNRPPQICRERTPASDRTCRNSKLSTIATEEVQCET